MSTRVSLAVGGATALAVLSFTSLTQDVGAVFGAVLAGFAVVGAGIAARRTGSEAMALLAEVGATVAVIVAGYVLTPIPGGPDAVVATALRHLRLSGAPMPPEPATGLMFIALGALVAMAADLFAAGLGRAALSTLPLFTPYLIPSLILTWDTPFWAFAATCGGILLVLGVDRATRGAPIISGNLRGSSAWAPAAALAALGLIAAQLVGIASPQLTAQALRWAPGTLQLADPSIDLRKNLIQPREQVILSYKTTAQDGVRLRLASLPNFTQQGWTLAAVDVRFGWLPGPPGYHGDAARVRTDVTLGDFVTTWLPAPYAPANQTAPGSWAYDPYSLAIVTSTGTGVAPRSTYTVTSLDTRPSAAAVLAAAAGTPDDGGLTRALPNDYPPEFRDLARRLTANASTAGAKAKALENWFHSPLFTYSLEPGPETGYVMLRRFLFVDHTGYCQQFATAMAAMARSLGIPARVAVGFTEGNRVGDHFEVTNHQLHSWTELYLDGLGWVSFDPTPSGTPTVAPTVAPTESATAAPSTASAPSTAASAAPKDVNENPTTTVSTQDLYPAIAAGLWVVAVLLLAVPRLVRTTQRRRRLRARGPEALEAAWSEVRATCIDLGIPWPNESPRGIASAIGARLDAPAAAALTDLAHGVELARYSPHATNSSDPAGLARTVTASLWTGVRRGRWSAWWRPVSVFGRPAP